MKQTNFICCVKGEDTVDYSKQIIKEILFRL